MRLPVDPLNLIVTGIGGQGTIAISRILGQTFSNAGFSVTIGETFGASQRGGSVMSHVRISKDLCLSPQIPEGHGHLIMAMEPVEAVNVLTKYGNPEIRVICNTRMNYSGRSGNKANQDFQDPAKVKNVISRLSTESWFINATDFVIERLGNAVYSNMVMLGALAGTGLLPFTREDFQEVLPNFIKAKTIDNNLLAYDAGLEMVQKKAIAA